MNPVDDFLEGFKEQAAKLYDLPDYEVDNSGSDLAKAVKAAGYDVSPRNLINSWNCWNMTTAEFKAQLSPNAADE